MVSAQPGLLAQPDEPLREKWLRLLLNATLGKRPLEETLTPEELSALMRKPGAAEQEKAPPE